MSNLAEYIRKLNDADDTERVYAAEDLGWLGGSEGVPALLERVRCEPAPAEPDRPTGTLARTR